MIAYNNDAHVRDYYDLKCTGWGKFEGERLAVQVAHERSLEGFIHDDFGSVDEGDYYCRVLFDDCPFIVCFREDAVGFVHELTSEAYEAAHAEYVERHEREDEDESEDEFAW
jgi:hypothetical protein